jgi:hypothetical protein
MRMLVNRNRHLLHRMEKNDEMIAIESITEQQNASVVWNYQGDGNAREKGGWDPVR